MIQFAEGALAGALGVVVVNTIRERRLSAFDAGTVWGASLAGISVWLICRPN